MITAFLTIFELSFITKTISEYVYKKIFTTKFSCVHVYCKQTYLNSEKLFSIKKTLTVLRIFSKKRQF